MAAGKRHKLILNTQVVTVCRPQVKNQATGLERSLPAHQAALSPHHWHRVSDFRCMMCRSSSPIPDGLRSLRATETNRLRQKASPETQGQLEKEHYSCPTSTQVIRRVAKASACGFPVGQVKPFPFRLLGERFFFPVDRDERTHRPCKMRGTYTPRRGDAHDIDEQCINYPRDVRDRGA